MGNQLSCLSGAVGETFGGPQTLGEMINPVLPPRPTPGLPPNHTHLRLMAPRVLVVEDEITVALLIEDMVSELAYEVAAVVPRLETAMGLLDSESFDLALLDVHLNGKTVFPFAAELEARDIPFLFATAYGPRGIPQEFRSHLVLQKPFGPVELRRALMELSGSPGR
jgi:CheY-like chemotaxis protein